MKKSVLILLSIIAFSCTPAFYLSGPTPTEVPQFHVADIYAANYGLYQMEMATTKLDTPVTIAWVTAEQLKWHTAVHPFTHMTGGWESDSTYRPPFHIRVECAFLYRADIMESVWLLNDFGKDSTRELDLFESGYSWHRRLWMADHFGGVNYANRQGDIKHIFWPPVGINTVDIFVYPDHALRYLNGRLVKTTWKDLDYDFRILVTMIVTEPTAKSAAWKPLIYVK